MSGLDSFLTQATHTGWLLARFWAVFILVPASLLFVGFELVLPGGVRALVRGWFSWLASWTSPLVRFRDNISAARLQILDRISTRLLLERRHRALPRKLEEFSARVNGALRNSGFLSGSDDAVQRTAGLLQGFKSDLAAVESLPNIPADTVELTVELRTARFVAVPLTFLGILLASLNAGLLYMYWDSADIGIFAYFLAGGMPMAELGIGVALKAINDSKSRGLGTLSIAAAAVLVVGIMAAFEYQIFLTFFEDNLKSSDLIRTYPWLLTLMPLIGVAMALTSAIVGYYAGKYWLEAVRIGTVVDLKRQVARANAFIDGLPQRLKAMSRDTNQAAASIESMAGALGERSKLESKISSELELQRLAFVQAVAKVDPAQWPSEHPGDEEDRHDVARWAWLMGPVAILAAAAHLIVFASLLRSTQLLPTGAAWIAWPAAFASIVVAVVSGSVAFERLEIAAFGDGKGQVVIYPRDPVLRWFALVGMSALAIATLAVAMLAYGASGILVGLILDLLFVVFMFAGHFNEQFSRGLSFVLVSIGWAGVLLVTGIGTALAWLALGLAAAIMLVAKSLLFIFGCPLTLAFKIWQARRGEREMALATTRAAA